MIRPIALKDAPAICTIYNYYILNTIVSFEENPVDTNEMEHRITKVIEKLPWIVFEEGKEILGYAYATIWKPRGAYRHAVETSVYLKPGAGGKGIGTKLYKKLLDLLRKQELHTAIGGIAQPNPISIALHEKFGFEKVAHFKEVGFKFGAWVDVAYWQLRL